MVFVGNIYLAYLSFEIQISRKTEFTILRDQINDSLYSIRRFRLAIYAYFVFL